MRIVGGDWRSTALAGLGKGDPAAHLRPTSDRVRESLFNILAHGGFDDPVPGARVLDLFAGTGALGLEALSRGATGAVFVENGRAAGRLITENIRRTGAGARARLLSLDATRLSTCPGAASNLVFLDPPYSRGLGERALSSARAGGWIAPGALIVWEEADAMPTPPGFEGSGLRSFGRTRITFLHALP